MFSVNRRRRLQLQSDIIKDLLKCFLQTHLLKYFPFQELLHQLLRAQGVVIEVTFKSLGRHESGILNKCEAKPYFSTKMKQFILCYLQILTLYSSE